MLGSEAQSSTDPRWNPSRNRGNRGRLRGDGLLRSIRVGASQNRPVQRALPWALYERNQPAAGFPGAGRAAPPLPALLRPSSLPPRRPPPSLSPHCPPPAAAARHAPAAAPHAAVRGGAGGGADLVRAVVAGLRAPGRHPRPVAGAADPSPGAPALPLVGRPPLRPLLFLRGAAGLRQDLVGLRAAGRPVHLLQHQLLLLDRGHCPLPLCHHCEGLTHGCGFALLLPHREVGAVGPAGPCSLLRDMVPSSNSFGMWGLLLPN